LRHETMPVLRPRLWLRVAIHLEPLRAVSLEHGVRRGLLVGGVLDVVELVRFRGGRAAVGACAAAPAAEEPYPHERGGEEGDAAYDAAYYGTNVARRRRGGGGGGGCVRARVGRTCRVGRRGI